MHFLKLIIITIVLLYLTVNLISAANEENNEEDRRRRLENVRSIDDDIYDEVFDRIRENTQIRLVHNYGKRDKRVYDIVRKGILFIGNKNDPYLKRNVERILVVERNLIIPKSSEKNEIIKFFYHTYKGEGINKLFCRIREHYVWDIKMSNSNLVKP